MKDILKYALLILLLLFVTTAYAQQGAAGANGRVIEQPVYLFYGFSEATILLKSGITACLPFNYNVVTEEMVFYRDGKLLALDMPDVDTIYLNDKKFVPFNNAFYEVLPTTVGMLYIRHRCKLMNKGKAAGYGGYLETAAISSLSSITLTDMVVPLKIDSGTKKQDVTAMWIRRRGQFFDVNTVKQLQLVFPDKKHVIRQFDKDQNIDRFGPENLLALMSFL
ncbi:hypothetical protein D770_06940 [Flammeovirgaceae bacterium 311]|nr:hypothetical protein D770_06940 [Flammeovirgaceae bacterium 311]